MTSALAGIFLILLGVVLCYWRHPNQQLFTSIAPRGAGAWGLLLCGLGQLLWIAFAGWRAGIFTAVALLMILLITLPMLTLLRRGAR